MRTRGMRATIGMLVLAALAMVLAAAAQGQDSTTTDSTAADDGNSVLRGQDPDKV